MKKTNAQAGIGHVLALGLVVLVFASVGYIGFKLYAKPQADSTSTTTVTQQAAKSDTPVAPQVKTASDLDKASATLDEVDTSSANQKDDATLDAQLNAF